MVRAISFLLLISTLLPLSRGDESLQIVTEYFYPFQYLDEDQKLLGLNTALVREVLKEANIDQPIELLPWARAFKMASSKHNVLIFSMVRTEQRENNFTWIGPLSISEPPRLIFRKDQHPRRPTSIEDLKNFSVCVTPKTPFHEKLVALGFVEGENLHEFHSLIKDTRLDEKFVTYVTKCDFHVTNLKPWFGPKGTTNRVYDSYDDYPLPDDIFGPEMSLYLSASKSFDPDLLQRIQHSYERGIADGSLFALCNETQGFPESTCSVLH